ncbi:PREDICTED: transcription factor HES-5-like, partial [Apaloderma vittatum]|uniref:transcription factor HES-5-like n=1 Tax=Apaloderma vittatum TaxID=57397 RepID=UPI000521AC46
MAPSNTLMIHVEEKPLPKEKNKLRKPVVEKMRRDRINSSIEQLKLLLEKEFQRHQPNSKLEKADILEVAVSYLKQQSQLQDQSEFIHKNPEQDFNSGYLRCLREAMHFLSYYEPRKETQVQLIKHFCKAQMGADVRYPPSLRNSPLAPSLCARKQPAQKTAAAPTIWRPASSELKPALGIMAPSALSLEILTPKEKNRLRKPIVEKLRRDRINSSIEQLKLLLEKEFQRHQPNSKLEKADILEMTVSYLKYSRGEYMHPSPSAKSLQQDYCEGYAWCLKEALQFLALHSANTETRMKLICHFQRSQAAPADS